MRRSPALTFAILVLTVVCIWSLNGSPWQGDESLPGLSRFSQTETLIELPIGDTVLVVPKAQIDSYAIYGHEQRVTRVKLRILLSELMGVRSDSLPEDQERIDLAFIDTPRFTSVHEQFAGRVDGFDGPTYFSADVSYFEKAAGIYQRRYYVRADESYRRPSGTKPWMHCRGYNFLEVTRCTVYGGWLTDSVYWGYELTSNHLSDWIPIDERLEEMIPSYVRE